MTSSAAVRHAKDVLIAMHVLTSIGWGVMATVQLALLVHGLNSDVVGRLQTYEVAQFLEDDLLDPFAIIAVYTGMMISALTPWGYFRHRWVLVKFVLSWASLLTAAIFISEWLPAAIEATKVGRDGPLAPLLIGTVAMITGIVLMSWISTAKPWGRRKAAGIRRVDLDPGIWTFVAVLLIPVVEWAIRLDYPVMTGPTIVVLLVYRAVKLRRTRRQAASTGEARAAEASNLR
jgi:hypothetical protein